MLLDSGASVECRPQHLVQFAVMGAAYARVALDCPDPSVGLLSVGEEESKGNELTREAHQLLKQAPDPLRRQHRGQTRLRRGRRRHRLRRIYRKRHAEDQRGARRDGRAAPSRGAVEHVWDASRLSAVAASVPAVSQTARLLRVWRGAARWPQRPLHRRARPVVAQGRSQCCGDGGEVRLRGPSEGLLDKLDARVTPRGAALSIDRLPFPDKVRRKSVWARPWQNSCPCVATRSARQTTRSASR